MTENKNAIICAEKNGADLKLYLSGSFLELNAMYGEITTQMFGTLLGNAKGETKHEIAKNAVCGLIHTIILASAEAFDRDNVESIDQELKPFVQAQFKERVNGFDSDIDVYFAQDGDVQKAATIKMLDDLDQTAKKARDDGDVESLIDVLSTLAAMASALEKAKKENSK